VALTREALKGLEEADTNLYAAAARRRLGELLGGDEGRELITKADEWMSRQQIRNPPAFTRLMAPGFE
jgi:eukaryotic-like serine/threonine-protein kinase